MSERARWAVLGAGVITGDFLAALPHAEHGVLHAVGARDGIRAREFADRFGAPVAGTYDEVLARGGGRTALESFVAFRGRAPQIDALLRHNGMTTSS